MATITPGTALIGNAGAPHNKNWSGTFIPTIWSARLNQKFYAASTFAACSNTDFEGEIKNLGDKVIINNIPTITINDYTVGTSLSYEVPTPTSLELPIDKAKYFAFQINDVIEHQSKPDMMSMFSDDAGQQMKTSVDRECWLATYNGAAAANMGGTAGVISGAYNLGTDAAPITVNTGNVLSTITAMASVLDEQNIPDTDRWMVITPAERQTLLNSNLAQAQFMGDSTSALRNGKIGRIDRFDIYLSTLLPRALADENWTGGADAGKVKRHAIVAGHKSAITMAAQINKVETVRNPSDFGDYVRGLMVYGRKVVVDVAMTTAIVAG